MLLDVWGELEMLKQTHKYLADGLIDVHQAGGLGGMAESLSGGSDSISKIISMEDSPSAGDASDQGNALLLHRQPG